MGQKLGRIDWEERWLRPLVAARRERLGADGAGPPRLLVRVDEFPYFDALDVPANGNETSRRFNAVMADAGVHHLMGINTSLVHRPLEPGDGDAVGLGSEELAVIEEMRAAGNVSFGQHGTTHRTRFADPRRHSEFCGLSDRELAAELDRGRRALVVAGIEPRVVVVPFNRFEASQWPVLAERFDVVCGGPESVGLMGFQGGPSYYGDAAYLPCYSPLYGRAGEVLPALERIIAMEPGTWVPVALHSMWEAEDDFRALGRLAALMAEYATDWGDLLGELDRVEAAVL